MDHPRVQGLSDWRSLARGSSSVVWEARQTSLERLVAVKVYERALDEDDQRRFLHEAAAIGRLSGHPGIVTSHAAGMLADDRPYLVMELCPGGSLARWLEPGNRPSEEQVLRVGVQIADALVAAHAAGLLHGDVKPGNVLIDEYGSPKLAYFGLAGTESGGSARRTGDRLTPAYAPPEVLKMRPATEAGDVFSLAATLYALLAGRPPRAGRTGNVDPEELADVSRRPIAPLASVNWFFMSVLATAMSDEPAGRPTAREFHDQLAALTLSPVRRRVWSRPGDPGARSAASASPRRSLGGAAHGVALRRPRRDAVLAVAVALTVLLGAASVWLLDRSAPSGTPPAASQVSDSPRPSVGTGASEGPAEAGTITLQPSTTTAKPFQAVRIEGWHDARAGTFLRVQRWERGSWRPFPLPTRTDASGNFIAHVEFGQPGRYQVRVVNPDSGQASAPIDLQIVAA